MVARQTKALVCPLTRRDRDVSEAPANRPGSTPPGHGERFNPALPRLQGGGKRVRNERPQLDSGSLWHATR
jgi:hypothetical protein